MTAGAAQNMIKLMCDDTAKRPGQHSVGVPELFTGHRRPYQSADTVAENVHEWQDFAIRPVRKRESAGLKMFRSAQVGAAASLQADDYEADELILRRDIGDKPRADKNSSVCKQPGYFPGQRG